jgi:hypothetical protein
LRRFGADLMSARFVVAAFAASTDRWGCSVGV